MRESKPVRPVQCKFCAIPLFYTGDPKHKPEVVVRVHRETGGAVQFYAHEK